MTLDVLLFLAYLLGSVPFGLVLTRMAGLGDLRHVGSGNIGATNVLRTGSKGLAFLTLLLDGLKGAVAVFLVAAFFPPYAAVGGFMALMGHMFPLWLDFKGGKGVATLMGILLALCWPVGIMVMLVWLASALIMRISSVSALFSALSAPMFLAIFDAPSFIPLVFLMILFVLVKHRRNIVRLIEGTEPWIGQNHDQKAA